MKKDSLDRRIKYTKKQLESAMVSLLQKNHISKITVTSLCEMADINRSTFYTHYKDQYDLLGRMSGEALENIRLYLDMRGDDSNTPVTETNLKMILEYGKSNSELFKAFLSDNCDTVFQKDLMQLLQVMPSYYNENTGGRTREYITGFMMSGCISILQRWLSDDMPESTREMSEIIFRIMNRGLGSFT